jgi:hypothetical protein
MAKGDASFGWPRRNVVKVERLAADEKFPFSHLVFHLDCGHTIMRQTRNTFAKSKTQLCGECQAAMVTL